MSFKKRRNTFTGALTRRGRRSFSKREFKPYEVKPINDISGWVGLNSNNTFGAFKELLSCADVEILMTFYQMRIEVPNKNTLINKLVEIIYSRILKGVKVKILLNNKFYIPSLRGIARASYKQLLKIGAEVRLYPINKMLHSKLIVVDKKITYIGSQNFTNTGISSNSETGLIVNSREIANFFIEYFDTIWKV